jgi:hypothetical protein
MIPVPLLTPWLSSLWLGLTTPVYARVGRGKRLGRTCSSVIAFAGELTLPCPPARHGKPSAVRSSDLQACITCAA